MLPLILVNAAGDYTQILTAAPVPFAMHVALTLGLLAFGIWLIRGRHDAPTGEPFIPKRG